MDDRTIIERAANAAWSTKVPTKPGLYYHRNPDNAGGRAPIHERLMYVGYVNWGEDPAKGHGTKPAPYKPPKLRAVRAEHPLTTDSLTVAEWGGYWKQAPDAASLAMGE